MSVTTPTERISVLTAGMDARKQAIFRMAFRLHTLHAYQLAADAAATPQLAIVDVDSGDGWRVWEHFRQQHPTLPALIVSAYGVEEAPAPLLAKPVRMENLFPLLRQLLAGTAPVNTPASPPRGSEDAAPEPVPPQETPRPEAPRLIAPPPRASLPAPAPALPAIPTPKRTLQRFHPDGTLYALLVKAARQKQPVLFGCEQTVLGWIAPQDGQVRLYTTLAKLQALAEMGPLRLFAEAAGTPPAPHAPTLDIGLPALLWQVALWSCRGRLLAGISPDAPLRLRQWPNLTRLAPLPDGLRIAALWSRTPTNLRVTASLLRVEPAHLCDFIAATFALGLLEQVGQNPSSDPAGPPPAASRPPSPQPAARQSLLSRLLGKIKNL